MFNALSLPFLLLIFGVAAIAIWIAGIQLSNTTDVLSSRLGLGEALGGNAFLPVLFLLTTLISGETVLPKAE